MHHRASFYSQHSRFVKETEGLVPVSRDLLEGTLVGNVQQAHEAKEKWLHHDDVQCLAVQIQMASRKECFCLCPSIYRRKIFLSISAVTLHAHEEKSQIGGENIACQDKFFA